MTSELRLAHYGGYIFLVRVMMTPTQIETLQNSFKLVSRDADRASQIFYDELFHRAPYLRQLFPEDMDRHRAKFVQMLAMIIKGLDQVSAISEDIVNLGRRHMSYDVQAEHYAIVGEALIAMLMRLLGPGLTPEIKDAWGAAYDMLARMMHDDTIMPMTTEGYYGVIVRSVLTAKYGVSAVTDQNSRPKIPIVRAINAARSDTN